MDVNYQIPRLALLWVLAALLLVILPGMLRLPLWILLLVLGCMGWRLLIFAGRAHYPGKLVKALIVFTALPLTVLQFRSQGVGLDAAVCLLILGVVFKLLEMQYKRDIVIVIVLAYVLTMIGFIYSQTIPSGLHALLAVRPAP
ncbi:MAG: transglutaminaseTgpA domain-containing protein [Pseudomonadota bacterium]